MKKYRPLSSRGNSQKVEELQERIFMQSQQALQPFLRGLALRLRDVLSGRLAADVPANEAGT